MINKLLRDAWNSAGDQQWVRIAIIVAVVALIAVGMWKGLDLGVVLGLLGN